MGNIKLAVCIPTYNRPEVVREFIENYMSLYLRHNFDIFIYDSSEDARTEMVVKEWEFQYTALHYVKVDSSIHSNMKVYNIFREFGKFQKYDYLWVCSDSIRWAECALDTVSTYIERGYDIIIPNYRDVENIGNKEYNDKNSIFMDCAWHMTLYGATILKVSTMLTEVDWETLIEKYTVPDCINHSHVAFYFEKLSTMDKWKAIHLSFSEEVLVASGLKKHSGWQRETFYVWCYCWPTMINKLPECYKGKNKVIKQSGINSKVLSYGNLKILRKEGILDQNVYHFYKEQWRHLTNVPRWVICFLAILPPDRIKYLEWEYIKLIILKKRIKRFCHKFDKIYIYGAGKKAMRYTDYLNAMGIPFEAYLVSDQSDAGEIINGHKVMLFCQSLQADKKNGILLALNETNTKEVFRNVLSNGSRKTLFSEFKE